MPMRGPRTRYRRIRTGRRKIKAIIIISVSVLLVLALGFLIVGNLLGKKTHTGVVDPVPQKKPMLSDAGHIKIRSINAYPLNLGRLNPSNPTAGINEAVTENITAVSVDLNEANGRLLYDSEVAQRFGYQSDTSGALPLRTVTENLSSGNVYVSGRLHISSFAEESDTSRSVLLAYEAALAGEAYRAGVNDIVLYCPSFDASQLDSLLRLVDNIRNVESYTVVGFAISSDILSAENSEELVTKIWEKVDFLAADFTSHPADDTIPAYLNDTIDTLLYYILRYNMRVLLPSSANDTVTASMLSVVTAKSITNWQITQ